MKHNAAMAIKTLGAASFVACAPVIDTIPTLAAPVVASLLITEPSPAPRATLDTVVAASAESQTAASLLDGGDGVQYLAAINVVASAGAPRNVPATPISVPRSSAPGSIVSYRFGESEPVLTCTVLRACVVELERAETLIDDPIAGDQARWIITTARTGKGGASTLVIVKPKACDVTTNLVLSTDRRIYNLDLDSPPCPGRDTNPKRAYTRHIRFSYPNESDTFTSSPSNDTVLTETVTVAPVEPTGSIGIGRTEVDPALNTRYRVVRDPRGPFGLFGRKRSGFPWQPTLLADDGEHVYVSLPEAAHKYPLPVLYALEDDGSRTIVNYVVRDTVIVTDRVFRRGVLVIPNGNQEQRLVFENRAWNALLQSDGRR